jgi:hypothetical protein
MTPFSVPILYEYTLRVYFKVFDFEYSKNYASDAAMLATNISRMSLSAFFSN